MKGIHRYAALAAFVLTALIGADAGAQCWSGSSCRANGHTVALSSPSPIQGVVWPYTEDITLPGFQPVGDVTVTQAAGWVKIDGGCVNFGEVNVAATNAFHGIFRVQPTVQSTTAATGSRFEIQLRLTPVPSGPTITLLTEQRRLNGQYPQADHMGVIKPDILPGNYQYSVWARLLSAGSVTFSNTYGTAQGVPSTYKGGASTAPSDVSVGTNWTNVGPSVSVNTTGTVPVDLILGSHWQIVSGTNAPGLQIRFLLDGITPTQFGQIGLPPSGSLPAGYDAFDGLLNVAPGNHSLQLQMKTTNFTAVVRGATIEYAAPPVTLPSPISTWPMMSSLRTDTIHVSEAGSALQPSVIENVCGRWTLLMEFDTPARPDGFVWWFNAYVQLLGNLSGSPASQIAIENLHYNLDGNGNPLFDAAADNAISWLTATPGKDGFYFFGEAYRWGTGGGGNKIRLWIRHVTCGGTPTGGFDVGRRFMTVKLMPSDGCFPQ